MLCFYRFRNQQNLKIESMDDMHVIMFFIFPIPTFLLITYVHSSHWNILVIHVRRQLLSVVSSVNNGVPLCGGCEIDCKEFKMIPRPKLTRIPGELPTSKADTYTQDLTKLTRPQLLELRDRQMKLLENK